MITIELVTFLATSVGSAWLTMMSQRQSDLAEERKWNAQHYTEAVAAAEAARGAESKWKGYYWVRGAMALLCASYFFLIPLIAMMIGNYQIVVGYVDILGLPLFGLDQDIIMWIKFGSGAADAKVLVYDPVKNNVMLSIIGMYFGNQVARKA